MIIEQYWDSKIEDALQKRTCGNAHLCKLSFCAGAKMVYDYMDAIYQSQSGADADKVFEGMKTLFDEVTAEMTKIQYNMKEIAQKRSNFLEEICANCGKTFGSHHGGTSPWPLNYCPGNEGKMDWDEGPGTVFKPKDKGEKNG